VAKLEPKSGKTCAIRRQKFVLRAQIFFVLHTKKNSICTSKIAFVLQK